VKELSALKIISKDRLHADDIKVMRGEARVLEMLEGRPNIVQLKNFYETQHYIIIEMEFLNGGQLKKLYENKMDYLRQTKPHKKNPRLLVAQSLVKKKSKTKLKYYTG
jgi:serine/threonine protein kinase